MGDVRSGIPDLAAIRIRRGLTLRQIAVATKIRAFYLEAIETGNFEKLPGGVYAKSFIRQYARAIDFDEASILRALPPDPEPEQAPAPRGKRVLLIRVLHFVRLPFAAQRTAPKRTG